MAWFSWFRKKESEDYEEILSSLTLDIQKRQTRLAEMRLRERRATLTVTMYTLISWMIYLAMWYTNTLPRMSGTSNNALEKVVKGLPVLVGPIVILFTRRIVQIWYTRKGDAEEKMLVNINKERSARIEEIKKKTGYYTTRTLLEKYDESPGKGNPQNGRGPMQPVPPPAPPMTPQRSGQPPSQSPPPRGSPSPGPLSAHQQQQPIPLPRKQWYDKLADAILGDDDASGPPAASRYALICQKCFSHNGLVKESMWLDAQYVCPKCGHFNPSARSQQRKPNANLTPGAQPQMQMRTPEAQSAVRHRANNKEPSENATAMDVDADS